jgi:CxxC motif-containing protein (DUF1111 family)
MNEPGTNAAWARLTRCAGSSVALAIAASLVACGGGSGTGTGAEPTVAAAAPTAAPAPAPATGSSPAPAPAASAPTPPPVTGPSPLPVTPAAPAAPPVTVSPDLGVPEFAPLFAADTQVTEQIQYTGANGELVTKIGFRTVERHAREGGEAPTDQVDKGSGRYLTYPAKYFQNRSFGLEVHDYVPLGQSKIEIFLRVIDGKFDGTTFSLFRGASTTQRDYGWNLNYGFNNSTLGDGHSIPLCGGDLPVDSCKLVVDSNWSHDPHDKLRIGDLIELAPASRLERWGEGVHQNDAVPAGKVRGNAMVDEGGSRYYGFEQLYVVGQGVRPWYGSATFIDSTPLPEWVLSGGQTSLSYNYSEEPMRVFQQMANNIGTLNTKRFVEGRRLFHTSFATGKHSEHENNNPVFEAHVGQVSGRFNQERCIACHTLNGRSVMPALGAPLDTMGVITGAPGGKVDANYGLNVQQHSTAAGADFAVSVQSFSTQTRTLEGGEKVELQKPVFAFKGPVPANFSVRQAQQVIGLGLLEAVDEATILALADPGDKNQDGVLGIPNWVTNPETGKLHLGRFGWKASKATLRQQAGDALMKDIGVTSPVYPSRSCQQGAADCRTASGATALSETEVQRLSDYLALLAVPAQRGIRTVFPAGEPVPPEHDVNEAQVAAGSKLFAQAACIACHTAQLKTGKTHPFAELREQTIHPYTNLLLHDLGPEMADTLTEGKATPNLWRTAPLWGIGSLPYVQGGEQNVRYLHDGRARTLAEAIGWHGGEATASRAKFEAMSKADRDAMVAFLRSL